MSIINGVEERMRATSNSADGMRARGLGVGGRVSLRATKISSGKEGKNLRGVCWRMLREAGDRDLTENEKKSKWDMRKEGPGCSPRGERAPEIDRRGGRAHVHCKSRDKRRKGSSCGSPSNPQGGRRAREPLKPVKYKVSFEPRRNHRTRRNVP